ncbi:MAG: hypothetical protein COB83_02885 [Gammaproteobacteria bacterium]|nr:MAG: hypothetical protein COB83_02885 [Gammaproteobacteria bacterium]
MIRFPNTLSFRLTFWYTCLVIVLITIVFYASYFSLKNKLDQDMKYDLFEDIVEYQILYQKEGLEGIKKEIEQEIKLGEEEGFFFQLYNQEKELIYSSDLSHWQFLPENNRTIEHVFSTRQPVFQTINIQGEDYRAKTIYDLIAPDVLLYTGETTQDIADVMILLSRIFFQMFLIAIPITFGIGWLMSTRAVKGIKEVSCIAAEIEKGNLDRRVSVLPQGDEITQLVDTFNAMLDRIRVLIFEMTEMTDNIAHDLRSPLARIRIISEVSLSNDRTHEEFRNAASDTIEECDRLLQMINSALDVAEVEADTLQITKQKVDLSQLIQDACELFEVISEDKGIKLTYNMENNCIINGNIQNLQRMIANILDNAIKYTLEGGVVDVVITSNRQNIKIIVIDTGMGIPEQDQTRVFDRFYRCDQSRAYDGCGLGLSFSKAVARSHGGDINLSSCLQKGSCFTIELPIT